MVTLSFEKTGRACASGRVDSIIMDCVRSGMDIFGGGGTAAILYHMEVRFGLGERQIPHNPRGFVSALRYMFGVQTNVVLHAIVVQMSKNATCDRDFLRFAGALENSMVLGSNEKANYLARGDALAVETSNQEADERSSWQVGNGSVGG